MLWPLNAAIGARVAVLAIVAVPAVWALARPNVTRPTRLRDIALSVVGGASAAKLTDTPGAGGKADFDFSFETVAKGDDNGLNYGAIKWEFKLRAGLVQDEDDDPESLAGTEGAKVRAVTRNPQPVTRAAVAPPAR